MIHMRRIFFSLALAASAALSANAQAIQIVPEPVEIVQPRTAAKYSISSKTRIFLASAELENGAAAINRYLKTYYGFTLQPAKGGGNGIVLGIQSLDGGKPGQYRLQVDKNGVVILGNDAEGVFHGIQSFLQLLPTAGKPAAIAIPYLLINDYPRFAYRGLHLDVGRHFMPVDFVKRYIDYLAFHKLNYFHWHLTDDQGWRIEIKKYPKLTSVGAWRHGTIIGRYPGTGTDNKPHGGYYTQDEVRDIVKYAAERYVTVIPEIEMPGHASAAIAAYPELSCFPDEPTIRYYPKASAWAGDSTGKQVIQSWGVYDDVFVPSENTFKFLENVLDEVMALFPAKYIHIGGDECPKTNWKKSAFCQELIKEKGLKDEHGLQSYFIQRMEKYINSKGRSIIGWDEILEGGLAPNALVMSWRGEEGGIAAAKENHEVIMTPGSHVYFDHSQSRNDDSVTIGGFLPLDKVYSYEPIPAELPADKAKFVLGAQANVWTEYINNPKKVEYTIFPRLGALSEVLWSPREKRNWKQFEQKVPVMMQRYRQWGANYSKAFYDLKAIVEPAPGNNGLKLTLEKAAPSVKAVYELKENGGQSSTKEYTIPLILSGSSTVEAWSEENNAPIGAKLSLSFSVNKATGKTVTLANPPSRNYKGQGGAFGLVNGLRSEKGLNSPEWLGWQGQNVEAVIDLGSVQSFSTVNLHTIGARGSWIYPPASLEVFGSNDGSTYTSLGKTSSFREGSGGAGWMSVQAPGASARYIKLVAENFGTIPAGANGAGGKSWLFADEIEVL